jgi:uncharacterized protein (DUF2141 family)
MGLLLKARLFLITALLGIVGISATALANPQTATIPGARANMDVLPARSFQSEAFSYEHQVTVALSCTRYETRNWLSSWSN